MDLELTQYKPDTDDTNEVIYRKLHEHFDGKIVRKDLTKAIKEGANVPVYVLEFLLGQYCSSDDPKIIERKEKCFFKQRIWLNHLATRLW
ncbi:MAG: ATP-dependent Lon protease [Clostridiales bacterium]|jgi:ATP-dependent Lon protease|nr:ATP-dependent Lon protease [Clostridiales bacterium]MDK2991300.1 ATP-dependent Lon protease [Clostridiales bacterium]